MTRADAGKTLEFIVIKSLMRDLARETAGNDQTRRGLYQEEATTGRGIFCFFAAEEPPAEDPNRARQSPICLAMMIFMISFVPAKIRCTRAAMYARVTGYSSIYP